MEIRQLATSKTINFNVFMPIILILLNQFGIEATNELVAAIMAIGNIILRFFTDKALEEK